MAKKVIIFLFIFPIVILGMAATTFVYSESTRNLLISSFNLESVINKKIKNFVSRKFNDTNLIIKINSIKLDDKFPKLEVDIERFKKDNSDILIPGKKIAFGVDSFEEYKMWYEEDFITLAELLFEKRLFDYIYLICGPDKSHISRKIINDSNKKYFIDCSSKDLQGVILAIKSADFYIGNNSGPLNMSSALGVKTFGLIANDPASELKFSKINPITPKDYIDNVWNRDMSGMKKLKPDEVFEQIIKKL